MNRFGLVVSLLFPLVAHADTRRSTPLPRIETAEYKAYLTATSYELGGALLYHRSKAYGLVKRRAPRQVLASAKGF